MVDICRFGAVSLAVTVTAVGVKSPVKICQIVFEQGEDRLGERIGIQVAHKKQVILADGFVDAV